MSVTFDLGAAIKAHRLSLGMSKAAYAAKIGVSDTTIREVENRKHYVYHMRLYILDKLLAALHMSRREYDPDFARMDDAARALGWARRRGATYKDIGSYMGITGVGARGLWRFFRDDDANFNYNTMRTAVSMLDDGFREYIENCTMNGDGTMDDQPKLSLTDMQEALVNVAKQQGFVQWELRDAVFMDGKMQWITGCGTYRIVLSLTEFKAYYAKTNTLSVYRDLTKKPEPLLPTAKKPVVREPIKIDPIAHYKQSEARNAASDMFRTIFGKG